MFIQENAFSVMSTGIKGGPVIKTLKSKYKRYKR